MFMEHGQTLPDFLRVYDPISGDNFERNMPQSCMCSISPAICLMDSMSLELGVASIGKLNQTPDITEARAMERLE